MPRHKRKGRNRRRGKNENEHIEPETIIAEPGQTYAQVTKLLGCGYLEALCQDSEKRICHIPGKMNKKIWIKTGDLILVGIRDFQDHKADVILKYNFDEVRFLLSKGEVLKSLCIREFDQFGQENGTENISFDKTWTHGLNSKSSGFEANPALANNKLVREKEMRASNSNQTRPSPVRVEFDSLSPREIALKSTNALKTHEQFVGVLAPDLTPSERFGLKLEHNAFDELNSKLPADSLLQWRVRNGEKTKIDKITKRFYRASIRAEPSANHIGAQVNGENSA